MKIQSLLFISISAAWGCSPDTVASRCDKGSVALAATKESILSTLVSPGSAVFSDLEVQRYNVCSFHIAGYVDSQNSFGALLRTDLDIIAQYNLSTGKWDIHNSAPIMAALRAMESRE